MAGWIARLIGPSDTWARAFRSGNPAAIIDWFSRWFLWSGAALLVVLDVTAMTEVRWGFLRVAAGCFLVAAASLVAGWLLGLLFGVPRALSRPNPGLGSPAADGADAAGTARADTAPAAAGGPQWRRPSRTNTNLEDVSDWLTKTIVGLALVNLYPAPHYLWVRSGLVADSLFASLPGGRAYVMLVGLYFSVGGFWIGYIGTRTLVTLLFDKVDMGLDSDTVDTSADPGNIKVDEGTGGIARASDGLLQADALVLAQPTYKLTTAREIAAKGAALARFGDLPRAMAFLREAVTDAPGDRSLRALLDKVAPVAKRQGSDS